MNDDDIQKIVDETTAFVIATHRDSMLAIAKYLKSIGQELQKSVDATRQKPIKGEDAQKLLAPVAKRLKDVVERLNRRKVRSARIMKIIVHKNEVSANDRLLTALDRMRSECERYRSEIERLTEK